MKKFIKPLLAVVIYLVVQGITGGFIGIVYALIKPEFAEALSSGNIPAGYLAVSTMVAGIISIAIIHSMKLINWSTVFKCGKVQSSNFWFPLIAAIAGLFSITVFEEQLQLENLMKDQFEGMMNSVIGVFSISIFVPIIEELCFREAVLGGMLRKGVRPWVAIAISALVFGLAHLNPVQIVGGGLIGLILGIIYFKSGNIVLTTILHIFNNSLATCLALKFGMDATLSDIVGSSTVAIIIGIICAVLCVTLFVRYWKHTRQD